MKSLLLFICFSLLTHTLLCSPSDDFTRDTASLTIPFFVWSENQLYTEKKQAQLIETLTSYDIENSFHSLLHLNENEDEEMDLDVLEGCAESIPEVLVLFVEPELRTDILCKQGGAFSLTGESGESLPNLKDVLSRSSITLSAPYVTLGSSSSLLDNTLVHVSENIKQGSIIVARDGDSPLFPVLRQLTGVQTVPVIGLIGYLKEHSEIFTNGLADLIVVTFESVDNLAQHDDIIGQVSNFISQQSAGKYVGIYTANTPVISEMLWRFPVPAEELETYLTYSQYAEYSFSGNGTGNTTNTTSPTNYFPAPILEAFMVIIPLIIMIFVGVCGLFSLQVPERYESPKVQKIM